MGGLTSPGAASVGRRSEVKNQKSAAYARGYVEPRRMEDSEWLDIAGGGGRNGHGMNTSSSGSARVDDSKGHPQGGVRGRANPVKFLKRRFSGAPEGTAALFFIVSRLLPAALDRYPRGLTGHVAHPSRSIQIFSTLGFAGLYSTSLG